MSMRTNRITLLVHEIESAISFYTHGFGLQLIEDTQISESKRIVRLGCTTTDVSFNLTTPKPGDEELVGRQAGQRVFIFLDTEDLDSDLQRSNNRGSPSTMAHELSHLDDAYWSKISQEICGSLLNDRR